MVINGHDISGKRVSRAHVVGGIKSLHLDARTRAFLLDALMADPDTQATLTLTDDGLRFTRYLFGCDWHVYLTKGARRAASK